MVQDSATTVTVPSNIEGSRLYLCYKIQGDSEYMLFTDNVVNIRGGFVVSPSITFEGVETIVTVEARSWNYTDIIKFVPEEESCEAEGFEYSFVEETTTVTVNFSTPGVYKMCYQYADVIMEVPQYTMTVHSLSIESTVVLVEEVKQAVKLEFLNTGVEVTEEKELPSDQLVIDREQSSEATRGDVSSITDGKDYTYAGFSVAKDVTLVYTLAKPVALSAVDLLSVSGTRSVKKVSFYTSVHTVTGPWKLWNQLELEEEPKEKVFTEWLVHGGSVREGGG